MASISTIGDQSGFIQSGAGATLVSSANDQSARSISGSAAFTQAQPLAEMSVSGVHFWQSIPPPNAWIRFWQKRILGITWRDLRPENDLETLKGLK